MNHESDFGHFDGRRVRLLRQRLGLSVEALANSADLTPRHVWRLESTTRSNIHASTLIRLALALQTSVDYLLCLTDDPRKPTQRA